MHDDTTPAHEAALRLRYRDAAHLLDEWRRRLSQGRTFVVTSASLRPGTPLVLNLVFPGLRRPIVLSGSVLGARIENGEQGLDVEVRFRSGDERERVAALVQRAADHDPALCARVVRILVVEDNPHIGALVTTGLEEAAHREFGGDVVFEIEQTGDGASALQAVERSSFDAVICDVYLPVMDGPRLIREIRAGRHAALPVLAVSAGGPAAREAALQAGCSRFLEKPLRLTELMEALRELLGLGK